MGEGNRKEGREKGGMGGRKALCVNSMQNGGGSLGTVGGRYWQREGREEEEGVHAGNPDSRF